MGDAIYLDHHATTPVDPRVLERMLPYFGERFGNASSRNHSFGWQAEEAVDVSRAAVASLIGATSREVIFTSGATEANNLAILGVADSYEGRHVVTQATEHKAVLDPCAVLERRGFAVTVLEVDADGRVAPGAVADALRDDTALVSVMAINNEVGTIQDLAAIGAVCRQAGVLFHTDAAQAAGKIALDVEAMKIDLLSLSAHKMYGPKGVGALYVRRRDPRVRLAAQIHGGGHERGLRSGTLNVPAIVGMGEAARIAEEVGAQESVRVRGLRDRLHAAIVDAVDDVTLNGPAEDRHPGNLNLSFAGVEAEALILAMRQVAVSSGAACASATLEPSHVLRAIGVSSERAHGSIRFGLGRFNTEEEIDRVAAEVIAKVAQVRALQA